MWAPLPPSQFIGISSTLDAFDARFARQEAYGSYVQALREQLGRLTSLMNDLLEFATPTRLELARGRFEDVVAKALSAVAPLQQRARVEIIRRDVVVRNAASRAVAAGVEHDDLVAHALGGHGEHAPELAATEQPQPRARSDHAGALT